MASGIEIDPSAMRQCSEELAAIAREVAAHWQALSARSESFGDIFGDDDVGGLIKISYQAAVDIAAECMTSVANGMTDFSDGLSTMATEYEIVEQDNENLFRLT